MADTLARREARRNRILGNSEDRLRRISGLTKVDCSGDNQVTGEGAHTSPTLPMTRDEPKNESSHFKPTQSSLINPQLVSSSEEIVFNASPCEEELTSLLGHFSKQPQSEGLLSESNQSQSMLATVFAARLHLVGLAIIVRLLLASNYAYLFGESIFVPLLTIQLAKYFGNFFVEGNSRSNGNILDAALLVSGTNVWRRTCGEVA